MPQQPLHCACCLESLCDDSEEQRVEKGGHFYHIACYKSSRIYCKDCGIEVQPYARYETYNGYFICDKCSDHYTACSSCELYCRLIDMNVNPPGRYSYLCPLCYDEAVACTDCGSLLSPDDSYYRGDRSFCEECYHTSNSIHNYSYIPKYVFYHKASDLKRVPSSCRTKLTTPLYFGFELEIELPTDTESDNDIAESLFNIAPRHIYIKDDGSLRHGFEVVTHPMTLSYLKDDFAPSLKSILRHLVDCRATSHNTTTCGLHIHATRSYVSDLGWSKIAKFFYTHFSNVRQVARRSPNEFCMLKDEAPRELLRSGKYFAISFSHSDTVEFRSFKGTLNYNTIMMSIEFVHALIHFAKSHSHVALRNHTWNDFVHFVNTNKKYYGYSYLPSDSRFLPPVTNSTLSVSPAEVLF